TRRLPEMLDKLDLAPAELELLRQTVQGSSTDVQRDYVEELPIIGIIRGPSESERKERRWWESLKEGNVLLPYETAATYYFRVPAQRKAGVYHARLLVDDVENVKGVFQRVRDMGLEGNAAIEFIEREKLMWLLVFGAMTCVAAVAMLVSAMGIANTMLMSVL